jgi:tight adherence protein B
VFLAMVVFLAVTLSLVGGYLVVSGHLHPDAGRVRRRLAEEFTKDPARSSPSTLYKNLDQLRLDPSQGMPDRLGPERTEAPPPRQLGVRERVDGLLEQADLPVTADQLLAVAIGLAFVLGGIGALTGGLLAGLAAATLGAAAPLVYVRWRRKVRREKYLQQLPAAFDLMSRVIRVGQSVPQSFQAVAEAFENPLRDEFANCLKQQNLGLRPEVAFQELMERSGIVEMRIFAMAMLIQRQSGGNLSEILERLAGLVRARVRLRQHVRTLTAEGRLQGWTLVVLPFLVFGVMLVVNRAYAEILFEHVPLLAAMAISMGLGILWIRRIVNFDR